MIIGKNSSFAIGTSVLFLSGNRAKLLRRVVLVTDS